MTTPRSKMAFAGFRHGHIYALHEAALKHPGLTVVGAVEEDPTARASVRASVKLTHDTLAELLEQTPCDIVAIGDYYAKRASLALAALRRGKHVILDKPICTSLRELDEMAALAKAGNLRIGCMLTLRTSLPFLQARQAIAAGLLGKVTQIMFNGQHPLMRSTRPSWYFEEGKQGGTINDIGIHGIDMLGFLTGASVQRILAAREWQAFDVQSAYFRDAAQFMLALSNGCGVLADVSYAAPNSQGYTLPTYWRFTVWGTKGMLEFSTTDKRVRAYLDGNKEATIYDEKPGDMPDYLESFLRDIKGEPVELNTAAVLNSSRKTLEIQALADKTE